jgi:hypothetical protein
MLLKDGIFFVSTMFYNNENELTLTAVAGAFVQCAYHSVTGNYISQPNNRRSRGWLTDEGNVIKFFSSFHD